MASSVGCGETYFARTDNKMDPEVYNTFKVQNIRVNFSLAA